MERIKLLTVAVIALLLLNMGTLAYLFVGQGHQRMGPPPPPHPRDIIIRKLHFDDAQVQQYEKLIQWHRGQIEVRDREIGKTKDRLYLSLIKSPPDLKVKDSLIGRLSALQKEIEEVHFKHFQDIKAICKPEQIGDYNSLTEELGRIFSRGAKRGKLF